MHSLAGCFWSYWASSSSDTELCLLRFFQRVSQVFTIKLVHTPGYSGIWQNDAVDTLAKQVLRSSPVVDLIPTFPRRICPRVVSEQFLLRRASRKLSTQTRSTLSRASPAVSSFLRNMLFVSVHSQTRRAPLGFDRNPNWRCFHGPHETSGHLT